MNEHLNVTLFAQMDFAFFPFENEWSRNSFVFVLASNYCISNDLNVSVANNCHLFDRITIVFSLIKHAAEITSNCIQKAKMFKHFSHR